MVKEKLINQIIHEKYYLCKNKKCKVGYFNKESNFLINKNELKVPLWFKEDADPKYICYCSRVTEKDIISAVKNKGAKNIKDVINITGAMENCNCEVNHPTGNCCSNIFKNTVDKILNSKKEGE